ncbi:hypothetical protein HDV63DRAFT_392454 [Trichoderma sp. SZMC 28014]
MEKINTFFSNLSSPPSSSSRPPQTPSPPSEEPTTFPRKRHSRVNHSKARLDTNSKKVEYLKLPKDSQDRTLLFRFMVYASGGALPSEVKKVTREAPKQRKSTVDCAPSKQTAQYSWVVRHQSRKRRRRSKDALENETLWAETGDIATHEEDGHEEDSQEEDIHEDDAHEAAFLCHLRYVRQSTQEISAESDIKGQGSSSKVAEIRILTGTLIQVLLMSRQGQPIFFVFS